MTLRLHKPWQPLDGDTVGRLPGQLGVYQIAAPDGRILYIGYAGGRSRFGLRGELDREWRARRPADRRFRYEITAQYLTRYRELLMVHIADHGAAPVDNADDLPERLGRLDPD